MFTIARQLKKTAILLLIAVFMTGIFQVPVAQASWRDILLQGAVEYFFLREVLLYQHNHQNQQILSSFKSEYGESKDERANKQLNDVMKRLQASVGAKETIKPKYSWFVNKSKDFNAFCGLGHTVSVNIGAFDFLNYNEDELAFILAHEMVHGQRMHSISSLKKIVAFSTAAQLYNERNPNNFSYIATYIVTKQLVAGYATLPQEKEADQNSFAYAVDAGYNPGAGAAVWARVIAKKGNSQGNIFENVINPNDHPTHAQREEYFSARLREHANNMVKVQKGIIYVADKAWFAPSTAGETLAVERAYFIAGNLAKVFHSSPKGGKATVDENDNIVIGQTHIMTPAGNDASAWDLADRLNSILGYTE